MRENFNFSKKLPFALYETDSRQEMMHSHDCLEINYIIEGTGFYLIEDRRYNINKDDIFLINNLEQHMAIHEENLKMLVFVFDKSFVWSASEEYDYLKPFFQRGNGFSNKIDISEQVHAKLKSTIFNIKKEFDEKSTGWELMIRAELMVSLALFFRHYSGQRALTKESRQSSYEKIRSVIEYIHEHFMEELSLEELAGLASVNRSYLTCLFKKIMHMSCFDYIERVRVNHAMLLLKSTDLSVLEVALDCGFKSSSYFARVFKKIMGISPLEYRKN